MGIASNNYAELITNRSEAQRIVAHFESVAARGCSFIVMEFNPAVDRFPISCGRESNFPTLPDVEVGGLVVKGTAITLLWSSNRHTIEAVNFGNGYFGLYYEAEDRSYIAISDGDQSIGSQYHPDGREEKESPHVCPKCTADFGCEDDPCTLAYESFCSDCSLHEEIRR